MIEIVGEPGLGKSFLLNRVLRRGAERAVAVSARPQDLLKPFGVLEGLLRRVSPVEVERPFERRSDVRGEAELIAWGERICAALRRRLAEEPALFVVDDLQWADAWSLKAMEVLRAEGVRFLVARRPGVGAPTADYSIKLRPLRVAQRRSRAGAADRRQSLPCGPAARRAA
jgi:KaiC/GvpD/RAD55 family RecA-like ATPase